MKHNTSGNKKNQSDCCIDLLQVFIVVVGAVVIYYLYQKHCQDVETFTENELSSKTVGELSDSERKSVCNPENQTIQGFRSLQSGATLKFELVGDNKYYLHGPPYKVVTVDVGNSLTLKAKNEVDGKTQIFTKVEKENISGTKCLVFTYGNDNPQLTLQYEHEHLSLRPLNSNGKAFSGQCFVAYEGASVSEIEANSLSLGISVPRLGNEDLMGSGHNNQVSSGSGSVQNNTPKTPTKTDNIPDVNTLGELTKKQFQDLMNIILKDVSLYNKEVSGGKPGDQNVFSLGDEGLTVNVNLQKQDGSVDGDTFTDLKGDNNSSSVRALLNTYTKSKKDTSFLEQVEKGSSLQNVSDVLRNKFKGCPGFDRSKYYSERQIAQCSGCSPDEFLRGKL
jgi:hypothetical protein